MFTKGSCRVKNVAAIIAKNVNNVEEVSFEERGPESLFEKVTKALKIAANNKMRSKLRWMWTHADSGLRSEVVSVLSTNDKKKTAADRVSIESNNKFKPNCKTDSSDPNNEENGVSYYQSLVSDGENVYTIINVAGDGNCLFRCFSYHLYGDENSHLLVRKKIVNYTVTKWLQEVDLLHATCEEKKYKNAKAYENIMGSCGAYGTDYEIGVFIRLYDISVSIFREEDEKGKIVRLQTLTNEKNNKDNHLNIMFTGQQRSGHWVILKTRPQTESSCIEKAAVMATQKGIQQLGFTDHKEEVKMNKEEYTEIPDTFNNTSKILCDLATKNAEREKIKGDFMTFDGMELEQIEQLIKNNQQDENASDIEMECHESHDLRDLCEQQDIDRHEDQETCPNHIKNEKRFQHVRKLSKGKEEESYKQSKLYHREISNNDPYEFILSSTEDSSSGSVDSVNFADRKEKKRDKNISDSERESDEFQNLASEVAKKKKSMPKGKRVPIFTKDLGTYDIPSSHFKNHLGRTDEDKIRRTIEEVMLYTLKCTCILGFYGSIRFNLRDVVAYAKCRKADHEQRFQFKIDFLNKPVARLQISSNKKIKVVHKQNMMVEIFRTLRGEERKKWLKEIRYRSVVDYLNQIQKETSTELKEDGHPQNLRHIDVLYKLKSEKKCKDRLSLKSGDLSDLMELWTQEQELKDPFLRYVSLPLTAIMYTSEDLQAMADQKPIVLHMDATGSVVRKPQYLKCKRIFYYCILAKHEIEIIKLAQMITSEHGIVSISTFLKQYKHFALEVNKKWPLAHAVVVDWSWAFIHSILQEWNSISLMGYLNVMYEYCLNNEYMPKRMSIVKICFAHFMKIVSKTIHDKYPEYKNFKAVILECMALLSISRNISQMDEIFKHMCTLLLSRNKDRTCDSIIVIKNLTNRNAEKLDEIAEMESDLERIELETILTEDKKNDTIYKNSPFFKRYNIIMSLVDNESDQNHDDQDKEIEISNEYYAPKFVLHLTTTWMPYVILWSSLDLDLVDPNISRLSNAFIESEFKVTKELVFQGVTNSSIADRVRQLNTARQTTIAKIMLNAKVKGKKGSYKKPKYPQTASNPFVEEEWQRKKNKGKKRAGYVKAPILKKLCIEVIKEKKDAIIEKNEIPSNAIKDKKINDVKNMIISDNKIEFHAETSLKSIPCNNIPKFFNGVITDSNYYMTSTSGLLTVGRYSTKQSISIENFQLSVHEFSTLRDHVWINGVVIDSYVAANIDDWIDTSFIPTEDTSMILGDFSGKRIDRNRKICKTNKLIKNTLLMPYLYQGHWRLLVVKIREENIILLDPYKSTNDNDRVIEMFKRFITFGDTNSSFHSLRKIKWKSCDINARPYQPYNDGHSCGAYIMYYMYCIGNNIPFNVDFYPIAYRREVAHELLLKSENMEKTCIHCFALTHRDVIKCKICKRQSHKECTFKSQVNTDDEEKEVKKKLKTKEKSGNNTAIDFICKLCQRYKGENIKNKD